MYQDLVRHSRVTRSAGRWVVIIWRIGVLTVLLGVGLVLALRWWTDRQYGPLICSPEDVPSRRVAIVFGASVLPDGRLSTVLADRVQTGVDLYHAGKVEKLLMTGDNRSVDYNEPAAMRAYARSRGVPAEDIVLDYAGQRTYDSCYRAIHIFGVTDAILVSQSFHLDRALFIAHRLGLDAVAASADHHEYAGIRYFWWRELLATALAWWEVSVSHPDLIMGEPLPIFPETHTPDHVHHNA